MTDERPDGGTTVHAGSHGNWSSAEAGTAGSRRRRLVRAAQQVGVIARSEISLGTRRRWGLVLVGLFGSFGLLLLTFAGSTPGPAGYERTVASLAVLSVYLVPLAALAYGYSAIVGHAESGWLGSIASLPVTRASIVVGIATGRAVVLAGGILVGFAIPGVVLVTEFGLGYWPSYAVVVLAATATGLCFLGIAVLCSALVREKTHALGAALLAWVWFVIVHDLLGLGVVAAFDLPASVVAAVVLANPASTYRVLVLDALGAASASGFGAVGASVGLSTTALAAGLVAWMVLPVTLAALTLSVRGLE